VTPRAREEKEKEGGEKQMDQVAVMEQVVKILTPWVKNEEALSNVGMETNILDDLKVNSARRVDVVIAFEDEFDIEIDDEDVDSVNTVGDAVNLISSKLG
jgi:acyl carrier protein